jgi:hypothetical protein
MKDAAARWKTLNAEEKKVRRVFPLVDCHEKQLLRFSHFIHALCN